MALDFFEDKTIETDEAIVHSRTDGIVHVTFKDGIEIDVALQDKMLKIYTDICLGKKRPFLFSGIGDVSITKEGREHSKNLEDVFPGSASAIIADNVAYKLIANFYLKVNKPSIPYKVFGDILSAELWLKAFL
ncbi:MAG: hypothetical protein Q7W45_15870 [Bacteroidota bacterium]|nr:hypothetical protein [Bacteroidota bacterium]MDP3145507.1 hypothetical protein [Bacteroidota bacterium]MDP3556467.1 hypothetical protein [Bacteroidota bacterium]